MIPKSLRACIHLCRKTYKCMGVRTFFFFFKRWSNYVIQGVKNSIKKCLVLLHYVSLGDRRLALLLFWIIVHCRGLWSPSLSPCGRVSLREPYLGCTSFSSYPVSSPSCLTWTPTSQQEADKGAVGSWKDRRRCLLKLQRVYKNCFSFSFFWKCPQPLFCGDEVAWFVA